MTLSWDIDFLRFLWKMARKSPHWEATVTIKRKVWLDWMSLIGFYWLVRKIIENAAPLHFQGGPQWLNCRHRYFLNSNPTRSKWRKQKTNDGGHRQKVAQTLCAPNRVPSGLFPTAPEGSVGSGSLLNPVLEMNFMGPCGSGKQKNGGNPTSLPFR